MRRTLGSFAAVTCLGTVCSIFCKPPSLARAHSPENSSQPDPALQSYFSANGLLNRGLYELAVVEYGKFLSEHENHEKAPVARYGLGVCLFRMGRHDAAVKELEPLQEQSQFQYAAEVGTILGQCHLHRGRHADAAAAFEKVATGSGDHDLADDAAAGWVEALYLDGRYDDAAEQCRRFVNSWSESPLRERVEFFRGLAEMARGNYSVAAERFTELLEHYPKGPFARQASLLLAQCYHHDNAIHKAIRQYRSVLAQTGSRYISEAMLALGTLLREQGKPGEAGSILDELLDKFPQSPLRSQAQSQRGRAWFDQGEFDRAAAMFRQVASHEGELGAEAAYWTAKCDLRKGDFTEAARRLSAAIEAFPESDLLAEMLYDRAIALVRGATYDDAIKALRTFRARFPEHMLAADALQLLATTEHQRRRYDNSLTYSREFLEQYPSHKLAPAVAFLACENEFLAARYDEAVEDYRRFLTRYPDDPQLTKANFRLGTALYRLQRFDEAEEFLSVVTNEAETDEVFRPALLALGDIHFQRSEWEQAERYLSDYLSTGLDVTSADDALLKLGLSRGRQGRGQEALDAYDRLIDRFEKSPHRLQAIFERGQVLGALKRLDGAVQAFEAVVDEGRDSRLRPYALNHLAAIAMQRKDFDQAADLYRRVEDADRGAGLTADAMFEHGQALMAAQRFKEAETAFARFLDRFPENGRAAEASAQRAIALARQDRHADAVEAINKMRQPSVTGLDPPLRSALSYEKAWCLRELGRTDEAAKVYRTLLDEETTGDFNVHAILELSGIEFTANRFEQAARLLRRLRKIKETNSAQIPPEVWEQATYRLAVCELELERLPEAAELFDEFVAAFPQSPLTASAGFFCGETLFKLGRHEQAVKHLTRVQEKFDDDPVFGPSLLRLGESLAALQRWARSERVFGEYLDRFKDSQQAFQARFGIGWARENQQRHDEAISAYRQVVAEHQGPTAARAQFQIGECLFAKKRYDEAVRELLKVDILYAYPEWSAAALYEAGRCFEKLGKSVEARAQFKQVAEKHGKTRWAELASQRLSDISGAGVPGRGG